MTPVVGEVAGRGPEPVSLTYLELNSGSTPRRRRLARRSSAPAPATRVPPELYQAPAANAAVANDQDPYIAEVVVPRHSQPINQGLPAVFRVPRRC